MSTPVIPVLNLAKLRARTRGRAQTDGALSLPKAFSFSSDDEEDSGCEVDQLSAGDSDDTPPRDSPPAPAAPAQPANPDALFVPVHWDMLPQVCFKHSARHQVARPQSVMLDKRRSWRLSASGDAADMTPRAGVSRLWLVPDVARRNRATLNAFVAGVDFGWTAMQNAARCALGSVWRNLVWARLATSAARGPVSLRGIVRARGIKRSDYAQVCTDVMRSIDSDGGDTRAELGVYQLLLAFCAYNPVFGYAQGMNMVAGAIVLNVEDAAARFWIMEHVAHRVLPHYWRTSWLGMRADMRVLRYFLHNQRPRLARRLASLEGADGYSLLLRQITLAWFSTLYTSVLPADCAHWLIDMVLVNGAAALFDMALRILIANEDLIERARDMHGLFLELSDYLGTLQSLDALLALKLPKPVRQAEVDVRRAAALTAVLAGDASAVPAQDAHGCACARELSDDSSGYSGDA